MRRKKRGFVSTIQEFMSSYTGKVILNYAYSWGAAVVILGALFKLTHLPGGNLMLFIGMGTEVIVFAISAFDKPYKSYKWESVFPHIKLNGAPDVDLSNKGEDEDTQQAGSIGMPATVVAAQSSAPPLAGGVSVAMQGQQPAAEGSHQLEGGQPGGTNFAGTVVVGGSVVGGAQPVVDGEMAESLSEATGDYIDKLKEMTEVLDKFHKATTSLSEMSDSLSQAYKVISDNSGNITAHSQGYVYQMENLNRNLSGLNTIYEIQLRSISSQLDTIKQVNDGLGRIKDMFEGSTQDSEKFHSETELMAKQIEQLNAVYARMLQAMTVNMK